MAARTRSIARCSHNGSNDSATGRQATVKAAGAGGRPRLGSSGGRSSARFSPRRFGAARLPGSGGRCRALALARPRRGSARVRQRSEPLRRRPSPRRRHRRLLRNEGGRRSWRESALRGVGRVLGPSSERGERGRALRDGLPPPRLDLRACGLGGARRRRDRVGRDERQPALVRRAAPPLRRAGRRQPSRLPRSTRLPRRANRSDTLRATPTRTAHRALAAAGCEAAGGEAASGWRRPSRTGSRPAAGRSRATASCAAAGPSCEAARGGRLGRGAAGACGRARAAGESGQPAGSRRRRRSGRAPSARALTRR